MGEALGHTGSGTSRVLKLSDGERHGGETGVHLTVESSGALHLEHVLLVKFTLEDSSSSFIFLWDTFSVGDVDVEADDITGSKAPLVDLLGGGHLGDDSVVGVDAVFENLVGEDGLDGVNVEFGSNARNSSSDIVVVVSDADSALGSEHGGVDGNGNVVLGAGGLVGLGGSDNTGEGGVGSPSSNVASGDNFADITVDKLDGLLLEGRVVANNVVDGHASGEGESSLSLLGFLGVVNFSNSLDKERIDSLADGPNTSICNAELLGLGKGGVSDQGGSLDLVENLRV